MTVPQALTIARERGVDLVEVAPTNVPPVCRLLDYGQFKYEQARKKKESRKGQKESALREVRLRPKISSHDFELKTRMALKLLGQGDKVKVSVLFRGREISHPQLGLALLQRLAKELESASSMERPPAMEGRRLHIVLMPTKVAAKEVPAPAKEA